MTTRAFSLGHTENSCSGFQTQVLLRGWKRSFIPLILYCKKVRGREREGEREGERETWREREKESGRGRERERERGRDGKKERELNLQWKLLFCRFSG